MSAQNNIGPKRVVVGAHYGLRDWLAQRVTAIVIALYAIVLFVSAMLVSEPGYGGWAALFAATWMKVFTLLALIAFVYHALLTTKRIAQIKPFYLALVDGEQVTCTPSLNEFPNLGLHQRPKECTSQLKMLYQESSMEVFLIVIDPRLKNDVSHQLLHFRALIIATNP